MSRPGGEPPLPGLQLYYGGTFDPFHNGHLAVACGVRDALGAAVHLVPAADPPHRPPPGAGAEDRATMVALGIAGQPGLRLERIELERARRSPGRPSWTVDTLAELRSRLGPQVPLAWLIGGDSLQGLMGWHRWQDLFALAHIVVVARPGNPLPARLPAPLAACVAQAAWATQMLLQQQPAGGLLAVDVPLQQESSTAVRAAVAAGADIRGWVPAAVARHVAQRRLYGFHAA